MREEYRPENKRKEEGQGAIVPKEDFPENRGPRLLVLMVECAAKEQAGKPRGMLGDQVVCGAMFPGEALMETRLEGGRRGAGATRQETRLEGERKGTGEARQEIVLEGDRMVRGLKDSDEAPIETRLEGCRKGIR